MGAAEARGWELLGHGHPRAYGALRRRWRELGIEAVPDFADVLDRADLLVLDNSSAGPEFASTGKPVLWLNSPAYRRHVHHGGRFWLWPEGQVTVDHPDDLLAGIERALADPPDVALARAAMVAGIYAYTDGHAAERAAAAIVTTLSGLPPTIGAMPRRVASERQPDLEYFVGRLGRLGASRSEIRSVIESWDAFDDDWTPERRAEVVRAGDAVLVAMLEERRAEYPYEPAAPDNRLDQADGQVVMGLEPPGLAPPRRKRGGRVLPDA